MDENYTTIEIKPFKSVKSTLVTLGIFFLVGIVIFFLWEGEDAAPVTIPDGPVKIELIGIRPNGGPNIYSPVTGEKISMPMPLSMAPEFWYMGNRQLDFIFRLPKNEYPIHLRPPTRALIPRTCGLIVGDHGVAISNDGTIGVVSITTSSRYGYKVLWWNFVEDVDKVDFTFRYYYGPPDKSQGQVFNGPFEVGVPVMSTKKHGGTITPTQIDSRNSSINFEISKQISPNCIVAFDHQGNRHFPVVTGEVAPRRQNWSHTIYFDSIKDAEVDFIQYQAPYPFKLKNIPTIFPIDVSIPSDGFRPGYHRALAKRLGITLTSQKGLHYHDLSSQQLIEGFDLLEGPRLYSVVDVIRNADPPIDFKSLDEWQQENIVKTLDQWYRSGFALKQYVAIFIGLKFNCPEYIDKAIDFYAKDITIPRTYQPNDILRAMQRNNLTLNPQQYEKLTNMLSPKDIRAYNFLILNNN